MSALLPESGAETSTEAAMLARRPRNGPESERLVALARRTLDRLITSGRMNDAEVARAAEVLIDITWLAAEGYISVDEMRARVRRAGERQLALIHERDELARRRGAVERDGEGGA